MKCIYDKLFMMYLFFLAILDLFFRKKYIISVKLVFLYLMNMKTQKISMNFTIFSDFCQFFWRFSTYIRFYHIF